MNTKKGSNEIASAVFDFILNFLKIKNEITTLGICCEECRGQNKNAAMITIVSFWFIKIITREHGLCGKEFKIQ